jgi:hypothetical protein
MSPKPLLMRSSKTTTSSWLYDYKNKNPGCRELRENTIFVIFLVPLLRKTTKNRFCKLLIFVSPVHFYVISTEFEKLIEHSIKVQNIVLGSMVFVAICMHTLLLNMSTR